jgi:hypothetical protein
MLTSLAVSVLVIAGIGMNATTAVTSNDVRPVIATDTSPLDLYIERLAYRESEGRESVQIIDSNGKWSRGCLQFQDETFLRYAAKFHETANIMDCAGQKRLARQILLTERNGWRHWFTSVTSKGLGLPPI